MANTGKPLSQRQLRVGEMIKQSLSMIFLKDEAKIPNIHFVECCTSGGIWGLKNGYCLTIGGEKNIYEKLS